MNPIKVFFRQFSWLFVAELWTKFVIFILLTIVAHIGTRELGIYSYVLSLVGIFSIATDFGTTGIYIREAKKADDKLGLFAQFFFLKICIVIFFVICGILWLVFAEATPEEWTYFALYGFSIIFHAFTILFFAHLRVREFFARESIIKIISKIFLLVFLGANMLFGSLTLRSVFFAYAVAGFVEFLMAAASIFFEVFRKIKNGTYRPHFATMKAMFYQSFPLGLSTVFWQIYYRIDTILLNQFKGDIITGYYAVSYSILQMINLIPSLAMSVIYPKLVDQFHIRSKNYIKHFWKIAVIFFILGILCSVFIIFCAPALPLYFGSEYVESIYLLRILAFTAPFLYVNAVLSYGLIVVKKTKTLTLFSLLGVIVNVSFNLLFIPQYGAVAASWATVITEAFITLCTLSTLIFVFKRL